ncbi:MAG: Hsp70 family protein, partial [Acidimicrobiia bacterium]|nr:Hsp70 family protein [Acidimicrobiia bacterium]
MIVRPDRKDQGVSYQLGIDLGTTYTAAAVFRDGRARIVELGQRTATIPSVIYLREDETILTGESASRRALTEPGRVAREFKRRVGDPTPLLLGGTPYSAEALMSKLLRWTVDRVSEREGGPPSQITVSHPANWGPFKTDLLGQAVRLADLDEAHLVTEPEAAAIYYSSQERVDTGTVIGVYDLGGGTFDAAVLRKTEEGFDILGRPEGIERLGGIDFDEAVFAHVRRSLDGMLEDLDPDDPAAMAAVARLRSEAVDAKEALSGDTEASIPVLLPNLSTEVRITRSEFETMIRPSLQESIGAMRRAFRSADVDDEEISAILLVGGSSRIPLVAQLVGAELGRPVALDVHPKHAIALGAAMVAANEELHAGGGHGSVADDVAAAAAAGTAVGAAAAPDASADESPADESPADESTRDAHAAGAAPVEEAPETDADDDRDERPAAAPVAAAAAGASTAAAASSSGDGSSGGGLNPLVIGGAIAAVVVIALIAVFALGGGGGETGAGPPHPPPTPTPAPRAPPPPT